MAANQVTLPAGFQLESQGTPALPEGFQIEGQSGPASTGDITSQPGYGNLANAVRSLYHGFTFGWSDEAEAAIGALEDHLRYGEDFNKSYQNRVNDIRQANQAFSSDYPKTDMALQLTGAALPAIATAGLLPEAGAATEAPRLVRAAQWAVKYPGTGAVIGAISGAGTAPTMEDIPSYAGRGAESGAVTGAVIPAVLSGVSKGFSLLGNALTQGEARPVTMAGRKLIQAIKRDQLTPAQVTQNLQELGPNATLADAAGENVLGLGRAATAFPGQAKNVAENVLTNRQIGSGQRVIDQIQNALGSKNFYDYMDNLNDIQKTGSKILYDKAYQTNIPVTPELYDLLKRPTMLKGLQSAARIAADEGDNVPMVIQGKTAPTKMLDYLKRGLDDVINSNTDDFGRVRGAEGYAAVKMKSQLLNIMDKANPDFAQARQAYAGPEALKTATQKGLGFLKEDSALTSRDLAKMTPSEQQSFRLGAAKSLIDKINNAPDTADMYKRLFQTSASRTKIRTIFPDEESFNNFADLMGKEAKFSRTRSVILGGSPTARIEAEKSDAVSDVPMALMDAARGSGSGTLFWLTRMLTGSQKTLPEPVRNELSSILFNPEQGQNVNFMNTVLLPAVRRQNLANQAKFAGNMAVSGAVPLMR